MKFRLKILTLALIPLLITTSLFAAKINIDASLLKMINTDGDETSCTLSSDRKLIIFARKPKGADTGDLYFTEFKRGKWTEPAPVTELNSDADDLSPFLSSDGKKIFFSSNRAGSLKSDSSANPSYDIYYSDRKDGKWSKPEQLYGVVNTMGDELHPSLTKDGGTIYFTRVSHGAVSRTTIVKVTKKSDFWEDVQTAKITGDNTISITSAAKSSFRDVYILSGYKNGSTSRNIYFSPISVENGGEVIEEPALNSEGDEISFCEISSTGIIIATNSGGTAGSYDLSIKKISKAVSAAIKKSDLVIKTITGNYKTSGAVNVRLLFFNSKKTGIDPVRSETREPDSNGDIKLTVSSDIKRILAIPGNADMKEFALEIFPGKISSTPLITFEQKIEKEFKTRSVYFDFNSADLQVADIPYIQELIEYLRRNSTLNLHIEGYADGIGSYHANRNISLIRAETVKEYLVKRGINKNRIKTAGNGFVKAEPNDTNQYNRRVDFIIK
jgi:outer membrane protein OmpA-like peptidoglycan-associated protein